MARPGAECARQLKVLSANVRGLRTNIGDLTHNCVLRHSTDIVVVTETWLNSDVEPTFGKIRGYTHWARKDRQERAGGGVAVCFKEGVQAQLLEVDTPPHMEAMFFRVVLADRSALLLCAMYRPPRQGPSSLQYLTDKLDDLLTVYSCSHVLVVGDLNHHLERHAYESLLTVQGLTDHVTFPTHERGGTLDPVISDLQEDTLQCHQLGLVGSSDHHAVLTQVDVGVARDEATTRTVWLWDKADWASLRRDLRHTEWVTVLQGGAESKARALTSRLLVLQRRHVPHRKYTTRPTDQPWFGYRCRVAAEAKYAAWLRYKRSPTRRNKDLHRAACRRMVVTSRWAMKKWEEDLRRKLRGPGVGNKTWWSLVKEKQGISRQDTIPPLTRQDGTVATSSKEKAQLLAALFAEKMRVEAPQHPPPRLDQQCEKTVTEVEVTQPQVKRLLQQLDTKKATGPDDVSPHLLKQCASELSAPLTSVFSACLRENTWPSVWKEARVVPVHKRSSRANPKNYRPISLLSVVGKVLERVVTDVVCHHLRDNYLLSEQQFGFRPGRSTSDLLMLLTKKWQDALDGGLDTVVVALDIAGAFDRVWHRGLMEKLRAKGIQGNLLQLLGNYLQGRTLQVVVNGQASESLPVEASVPQGSVLGPVLWNVYVDDLLQQLPAVSAYADDCTLSFTYPRQDSGRAADEVNHQLRVIQEWGERWQVTFAPEKTQAMVVSRSPTAGPAVEGRIRFGGVPLLLQEAVKILGVEVDRGLRFDGHIKHIAQKASHRVSALRRTAGFLDRTGRLLLYKAQIRPYLEYAALSWMSCAASHIKKLDCIQRRALRLVDAADPPTQPEHESQLDSLEHRRDVAGLVVFHKAMVQKIPHLAGLRQPPRVTTQSTRTVLNSGDAVEVPRSHASQHQRTFVGRVSRMWNIFTAATPHIREMNTQSAKLAAHKWRGAQPTPLNLFVC